MITVRTQFRISSFSWLGRLLKSSGRCQARRRRSDGEMAAEAPGKWCNYTMFFAWSPEASTDERVPDIAAALETVGEPLAAG